MTRLRFTQPWGPYKPGDTIDVQEARTVDWHVNVCKRAAIVPLAIPDIPVVSKVYPEPKYLRKAKRDKMVKSPAKAKAGFYTPDGLD